MTDNPVEHLASVLDQYGFTRDVAEFGRTRWVMTAAQHTATIEVTMSTEGAKLDVRIDDELIATVGPRQAAGMVIGSNAVTLDALVQPAIMYARLLAF